MMSVRARSLLNQFVNAFCFHGRIDTWILRYFYYFWSNWVCPWKPFFTLNNRLCSGIYCTVYYGKCLIELFAKIPVKNFQTKKWFNYFRSAILYDITERGKNLANLEKLIFSLNTFVIKKKKGYIIFVT